MSESALLSAKASSSLPPDLVTEIPRRTEMAFTSSM